MVRDIKTIIIPQKMKLIKKSELARDRARIKLLTTRQSLKLRVKGNEAKMDWRKLEQAKSLNPTARLKTLAMREWAKLIRNPANWSSVPIKPRYSSVKPKSRVYGKRFEVWEKLNKMSPM